MKKYYLFGGEITSIYAQEGFAAAYLYGKENGDFAVSDNCTSEKYDGEGFEEITEIEYKRFLQLCK